jgi:hypothetical protein
MMDMRVSIDVFGLLRLVVGSSPLQRNLFYSSVGGIGKLLKRNMCPSRYY